jgi:hypothetical protein
MSRIESPIRFGPATTLSLRSDLASERRVLSRVCADLETSVRKIVRLAREPGEQRAVLGYRGARVQPPAIDRAALEGIRDEALHDARSRLATLLLLLDSEGERV